jgi:hypothetical protein
MADFDALNGSALKPRDLRKEALEREAVARSRPAADSGRGPSSESSFSPTDGAPRTEPAARPLRIVQFFDPAEVDRLEQPNEACPGSGESLADKGAGRTMRRASPIRLRLRPMNSSTAGWIRGRPNRRWLDILDELFRSSCGEDGTRHPVEPLP